MMRRLISLVVLASLTGFALTACGRSPSGIYVHTGSGMAAYDKLEFESGDTVDLTSSLGPTMQGAYKMDGDKVVITIAAGASLVFAIDDAGCLDGGGLMGKYCKQ